ncbi:MAG: succinylglutamate desuccinylase/aspartoacylase family protein [Pseudomonadota bacterium]
MKRESIELMAPAPGVRYSLDVLRFGAKGAGPKAYIQAALHADEVPAILVAQALKRQLEAAEAAGMLRGEVVLVPFANPAGMSQQVLGQHHGRFDLRDGGNFNRGYADVTAQVAALIGPLLGDDPERNAQLIRDALRQASLNLTATHPVQDLKNRLLQLALDSDVVLDLHCDHEAVMHVYALTPQSTQAIELGALLGARAILLATESGDSPFDEACSRPWYELQRQFAGHPIRLGCFSATVELRGESDTSHELAERDAGAIMAFLRLRGILRPTADSPEMPQLLCTPTPLACSEPLTAPTFGVVVFHRRPGDLVQAGELIADLVDPQTGAIVPVRCQSAGVFYARSGVRWAAPGKRLGKIAGNTLQRSGKLLSP